MYRVDNAANEHDPLEKSAKRFDPPPHATPCKCLVSSLFRRLGSSTESRPLMTLCRIFVLLPLGLAKRYPSSFTPYVSTIVRSGCAFSSRTAARRECPTMILLYLHLRLTNIHSFDPITYDSHLFGYSRQGK